MSKLPVLSSGTTCKIRKNKKKSKRNNNAQNTQDYAYFFPAMVEENEACSNKLNQYEQNNEE
jgi:hypothetical protein